MEVWSVVGRIFSYGNAYCLIWPPLVLQFFCRRLMIALYVLQPPAPSGCEQLLIHDPSRTITNDNDKARVTIFNRYLQRPMQAMETTCHSTPKPPLTTSGPADTSPSSTWPHPSFSRTASPRATPAAAYTQVSPAHLPLTDPRLTSAPTPSSP